MSSRDIRPAVRRSAALLGEFVFVSGVLFGSLGVAVMILGGFGPLQSGTGIAFFVVVLVIAVVHHVWYARNREEITSNRAQKALRERRGY